MVDKFDFDEFDKRTHEEYLAYQGELQQTNDRKGIALLNTNYFQSCLKDLMESILHSKEARRIPVKLIVSILKEKGIFSSDETKQAMKICEIRDWFAHRVNLKSIEDDVTKSLSSISVNIPHLEPELEPFGVDFQMVIDDEEWRHFDVYQKLDFLCNDLSATVTHHALYHKGRPPMNV